LRVQVEALAFLAVLAAALTLASCAERPAPPAPVAVVVAQATVPRSVPERVVGLIGLAPPAIEDALGPPVMRRPEAGGEVWLYATPDGCSLDLVLFPDRSGLPRVEHASTRTPVTLSEADCLRAVAERPRP